LKKFEEYIEINGNTLNYDFQVLYIGGTHASAFTSLRNRYSQLPGYFDIFVGFNGSNRQARENLNRLANSATNVVLCTINNGSSGDNIMSNLLVLFDTMIEVSIEINRPDVVASLRITRDNPCMGYIDGARRCIAQCVVKIRACILTVMLQSLMVDAHHGHHIQLML